MTMAERHILSEIAFHSLSVFCKIISPLDVNVPSGSSDNLYALTARSWARISTGSSTIPPIRGA